MPTKRSQRAQRFSDQDEKTLAVLVLSEFLRECEDLADGKGLTREPKFEAILPPRYVRRSLQNQPGDSDAFWCHIWAKLEELYSNIDAASIRCTCRDLTEFVRLSAECLIRDERDVMRYYRNFLTIVVHFHDNDKPTDDDLNAMFFEGFHPEDQDILADHIFKMNPRHPVDRPFDIRDVLSAARRYFARNRFYKPLQLRLRNELHGRSRAPRRGEPEKFIQRLLARYNDGSDSDLEDDSSVPSSPERSTYETQRVRLKEPSSARSSHTKDEHDAAVALITKMKGLSVQEPSYLALYLQCQERFPDLTEHFPKPELFPSQTPSVAAVAYRSPSPPAPVRQQPWVPVAPSASASSSSATDKDIFFSEKKGARTRGCAFCSMPGHRIRGCPAAEEYVDTGRVKIVNNRLHLPTGQPIPNYYGRRGLGLQTSVDAWLAALTNGPSGDSTAPALQARRARPRVTELQRLRDHPGSELLVPTGAYIPADGANSPS